MQENGFDGIVLECWSQLEGRFNEELIRVISQLANQLKASADITFVLVIPPPIYHG